MPKLLFLGCLLAAAAAGQQPATAPDQIHLAWVEEPSTTFTVIWHTADPKAASTVEYRVAGASKWNDVQGGPRASGTEGMLHEAILRGLKPATRYEYRVNGANGTWSEVFSTRTAPPRGPADFEVVFVADTGMIGRTDGLTTGTRQVIDEIAKLDPLLVLLDGDYIYFDTDKRWVTQEKTIDAWFEQVSPIAHRAPMMPTYGNHELHLQETYEPWAARFPTPEGFDHRKFYSYNVANTHFVAILESGSPTSELPQAAMAWIEQDVRAAQKAGYQWIIPYMHVAPFSDGSNHPSDLTVRAQMGPLMEKLGIPFVLTAHDQSYERTYPLRGVPDHIEATSKDKNCYTPKDGVSWVKISPGGKMSSINGKFAQFRTNPPPEWTVVRDNTMHHYARLKISAKTVRVEVFGVTGDGKPPVTVDTFQYSADGCR